MTGADLADVGAEVIVDARGCHPDRLRSEPELAALLDAVVRDLDLKPLGELWHAFPRPGGVTGLLLLSESHLAVHTFPELGTATFNLYCCRPRAPWPWEAELARRLGATAVSVRTVERGRP